AVVLDPDAGDAKPCCERRRLEERRESAVEGDHWLTPEGKPLAVPPERLGPRGDRRSTRKRPVRIVHRLQRTETLFARRSRGGRMRGTAKLAGLGQRTWYGPCRSPRGATRKIECGRHGCESPKKRKRPVPKRHSGREAF